MVASSQKWVICNIYTPRHDSRILARRGWWSFVLIPCMWKALQSMPIYSSAPRIYSRLYGSKSVRSFDGALCDCAALRPCNAASVIEVRPTTRKLRNISSIGMIAIFTSVAKRVAAGVDCIVHTMRRWGEKNVRLKMISRDWERRLTVRYLLKKCDVKWLG